MSSNVILITVDQWRGDCLSIDGHPVVHTPSLDQIALDGVRFSRTYAACPICIPARASLMSGLSPQTHGRVGYRDGVPWNYPTTIAGEFTRHGYQTQAIGKMHVFPERARIGFENVILHDGFLHFARRNHPDSTMVDDYLPWLRRETGNPAADHFDHGIGCNTLLARPWDKEERLHPTNWVVTQAIDFLRRRDPTTPFFLNLSFHRPHPPYDPPAWAFEQYLNADLPPPFSGDWNDEISIESRPHQADCHHGKVDDRILRRARAGYFGNITHIDHQIGRFLEILHEYHMHDNSWIVFLSDHGEMLGDHNLWRKGYPYEGSARVPLLIKAPREESFPSGVARDTLCELRDIMPTLLDCVDLPVPECAEGRSLLPAARYGGQTVREFLHGEGVLDDNSTQWLTDGEEKYVWFGHDGTEQLFNLSDDPCETRNLARSPASAVQASLATWRTRLAGELAGREEGFVDKIGNLVPGRPASSLLHHPRRHRNVTAD